MTLPIRKYMALPKVAELLKCSVEDIVHWASNGDTKVGVIYETDIFFRPPVFELGKGSSNKRLEDFSGFAFIHAGYMTSGEVSGICKFNGLELPDGRMVVFTPNDTPSEYQKYQMIGIELHQLYMRQEEVDALLIIQADNTHLENKTTINIKEMWVAKAWEHGEIYMEAWREAGYEPTIANIGLYVEGYFSNNKIYNSRNEIIDRATIVREALTGITGNKVGHKTNKLKIPDGKIGQLPEKK